MSQSIEELRKKISSASDLGSVVKTMKALAASSLAQYDRSAASIEEYYQTVQLTISACLRGAQRGLPDLASKSPSDAIDVVIFGSDQGLVGRFNESIAEYFLSHIRQEKSKVNVWIVGERLESLLTASEIAIAGKFPVPHSLNTITPLIGNILTASKTGAITSFYNRPEGPSSHRPTHVRILPFGLDTEGLPASEPWPTRQIPDILGDPTRTLRAAVGEHIFVALYRSCVHSLAAENSSRLAAMQRAEKNIDEILEDLGLVYHRLRQGNIDEELFDVIAGFEALMEGARKS